MAWYNTQRSGAAQLNTMKVANAQKILADRMIEQGLVTKTKVGVLVQTSSGQLLDQKGVETLIRLDWGYVRADYWFCADVLNLLDIKLSVDDSLAERIPYAICFDDCIFDADSGKTFSYEYLGSPAVKKLSWGYEQVADADGLDGTVTLAYLQSFNNEKVLRQLLEMVGYCMLDSNPLQTGHVFIGYSGTGKTTYVKHLSKILDDNKSLWVEKFAATTLKDVLKSRLVIADDMTVKLDTTSARTLFAGTYESSTIKEAAPHAIVTAVNTDTIYKDLGAMNRRILEIKSSRWQPLDDQKPMAVVLKAYQREAPQLLKAGLLTTRIIAKENKLTR